jgi:hypothetical protein
VVAVQLVQLAQIQYLARSHRLVEEMAQRLLTNRLAGLLEVVAAQAAAVMFGKVVQAQAVLVAQETLHQHHQLKAQMVVRVKLISQLILICKQAVEVVLVKLVKMVKQLSVVKAVMAQHPLFLAHL